MSAITIRDVYARFVDIHGRSGPKRARWELALAIKSARLKLHEVSPEWLGRLRPEWVRGESERPFPTDPENAAYVAFRSETERTA